MCGIYSCIDTVLKSDVYIPSKLSEQLKNGTKISASHSVLELLIENDEMCKLLF